ncbi:MAG TPA: RidA family protein [Actinomycetota bacterium]|nr:RidA family protein [Actinomycetota bacterium]
MDRRLIGSGAPWEAVAGYSRAVVAGDHVLVSGTVAVMPDGADPPPDAAGQARRCFEIIFAALAEAGAGPGDVVRTRMYLTRMEDADEVIGVHGELFGNVRPAATAVVVQSLIDPRYRIEIEADAVMPR